MAAVLCGIIGYVGSKEAAPILLSGLKRMEYRGYDSAGVAVLGNGGIEVRKGVGKIDEVHTRLHLLGPNGRIGIGHTRWATHGGVTPENAHPHVSCDERWAVVHNGIIENYPELRAELSKEGHVFRSETDTEVIVHLLEKNYSITKDARRSLLATTGGLTGAFSFVALFRDLQDTLMVARKDSPVIVGMGNGEAFVGSDVLSFVEHTDQAIFLDNLRVALIQPDRAEIRDFRGRKRPQRPVTVAWEPSSASKREYVHYTLKEIHEQRETLVTAQYQPEDKLAEFVRTISESPNLCITAAGSSFHAGLIGRYLLMKLGKRRVEAVLSSEFSIYDGSLGPETVVLAISQSGETADVLSAISSARNQNAKVISIVNTMGSSIARASDVALFLNCGPEIGVAATKSFTSQLIVLYLAVSRMVGGGLMLGFESLGAAAGSVLGTEETIRRIAQEQRLERDFYFVGRGIHHPIALEGALKLKELAYVHAEGMAAGELKHGTLALIEDGTPAVVINPEDETHADTMSNAAEMKARGATIIGVSNRPSDIYDYHIPIPEVPRHLYPMIEVIPLQLLAYHAALVREHNPDYPRNLAKSVTVR